MVTRDKCFIRCRYCDSNWSHDDSYYIIPLPKDKNVGHDKVSFICPACGYASKSYVFEDDDY